MRCFHDTFCNYMFGRLSVCGRVSCHGPLLALLGKVTRALSPAVAFTLEIIPDCMVITTLALNLFAHLCHC